MTVAPIMLAVLQAWAAENKMMTEPSLDTGDPVQQKL